MSKTVYAWAGRNLTKVEITNDSGLTRAIEFTYDQYNNQTSQKEYDYDDPGTLGDLLRTTTTTYETGSGWLAKNLIGLPTSVVTTVNSSPVSKTTVVYDNGGSDTGMTFYEDMDISTHDIHFNKNVEEYDEEICPDGLAPSLSALPDGCTIIHHDGYSSASAYRGNLTKVTGFTDATLTTDTNAEVSDYVYDMAGNLIEATVSCCNVKTISYGSYFSETGYAYPVSETKGSSPQLMSSAAYDYNTGLVTSASNENSQATTFEYEADTLRPKKTNFANGGYVETEYSDKLITSTNDLLPGFTRQTTKLDSSNTVQSYSYYNGRGNSIRSATETVDGWNIAAVEFDKLGRPLKSYNPFYGTTPTDSIPSGTKFTELTEIDSLGRVTVTKLQDDTTVATAFSSPNDLPSGFTSSFVTVTDQAGKKRRQIFDSLGRVIRVDEPNGSGVLGDVDDPYQPTFYEFDGNGNLSKVTLSDGNNDQERKFQYDSLSRLVAERQVEASPTLDLDGTHGTASSTKWTRVFKYSSQGLLTDGYDARGVRTQLAYDGLNRLSTLSYSGESGYETPTVTYTYDQARSGHFNAGALTKVETATSGDALATKTEFDYDLMGRAVKHRQWIGSQEFDLEYGYNIAGQLTSEKYPSGKIVTVGYDAKGRLSDLSDESRTFLEDLEYQGKGGSLSEMSFGNGTSQTMALNDRFQMTNQTLSLGTDVLQKYDYGYGQIDGSGDLDTTKNNGQLARVESYIGSSKQWTQKFSYDPLGRLAQSAEYRGDNSSLTYKQTFDFDQFGNMYRKVANNGTSGQANPLPYTPIEDSHISKTTNRFTSDTTYDDAGNVVTDNKFRTMSFGYDANGRMVKAVKSGEPDGLSVYDAAGMRVAEHVNSIWRFSVYDIGGKIVAEYGGLQPMDAGGVQYVLQDWQGSTRAVLSNTGFVTNRNDYTAFGEDIALEVGLRTVEQGFGGSEAIRQKYGLTERDDATGLDHTWFRKHENRSGRWTSPDPYNGSMNLGDPQSFNRYAYVQGQPTNFVDPSGLLRIQQCTKYWWYDGNGDYHSIITGCETIYDDGSGNQIVSSAYDLAKDLVRNPECAKLFGGSKKASETLSKMQKNTMISSTHPPINFNPSGSRGYSGIGVPFINVVAWTATWSWNKKSYGSVFIDPNGQFFQPSDRTIAQGSDILVDSNIFNAIVILHEMKHWNRNTSVSNHTAVWNTDLYNKCVRKNAMLGTDPSAGPNSTSA